MIDAKTLLRITQIDMPPEALRQVLQVLADVQFSEDERKAKDRDRKRAGRVVGKSSENPRKILRHSDGNGVEIPTDNPAPSAPQRDIIKPPTNPSPSSLRSEARDAFREAFDRFWSIFPNKVGKPVAERNFAKLWRQMDGDVTSIMSGLDAYIRGKPVDRPWLNPSTFLSQRRFEDQPASASNARAGPMPRTPTMAEMARMDEPGFNFDDQRTDHSEQKGARDPDEGRRGFVGPLSFEDHPVQRRDKLVDH